MRERGKTTVTQSSRCRRCYSESCDTSGTIMEKKNKAMDQILSGEVFKRWVPTINEIMQKKYVCSKTLHPYDIFEHVTPSPWALPSHSSGCSQDFWTWLQRLAPTQPGEHQWGPTPMFCVRVCLTAAVPVHPKGVGRGWGQFKFHTKLGNHFFMGQALCTLMLKQERALPDQLPSLSQTVHCSAQTSR